MTAPNAIEVRDISKKFLLRRDGRPASLKEAILRRNAHVEDFWALRDISLDIEEGSFFGLIGHNGSGKSTLLRLMAGIHEPTSGVVRANGRISALLELGSGFHPKLTGRENIFLNGAILGLNKRQMDSVLDDIIDFSGLGSFIDSPLKAYSSGMVVRLGFAVAINVEPEILLIDEVIAVGDEEFQRRCMEHLFKLRREGVTLVLVSHAHSLVESMCDRVAWLDHGRLKQLGDPIEVVQQYLAWVNQQELDRLTVDGERAGEAVGADGPNRLGSGEIRVTRLDLLSAGGDEVGVATCGGPVVLRLWYEATAPVDDPVFTIGIFDNSGMLISQPSSRHARWDQHSIAPGHGYLDVAFERMPLLPGTFVVSTEVRSADDLHCYDSWDQANKLTVQPGTSLERHGIIELTGEWRGPVASDGA